VTTSKFDMMYGRQGGRIVPFAAEAHDHEARTCAGCGGPLTNPDPAVATHRDCAAPAPADDAQGTLL
jgi:hypothetical protein